MSRNSNKKYYDRRCRKLHATVSRKVKEEIDNKLNNMSFHERLRFLLHGSRDNKG